LAESSALKAAKTALNLLAAGNAAVQEMLDELKTDLGNGTGLTVEKAVEKFRTFLAGGDYSPATLVKYASALDLLLRVWGPTRELGSLTKADGVKLRDTLQHLRMGWQNTVTLEAGAGEEVLSSRTTELYLTCCKRFTRWTVDEGLVSEDVLNGIKLARVGRKNGKRVPDLAQMKELLSLPCPKWCSQITWATMARIGCLSAMRIGEIGQLRAANVVTVDSVKCFDLRELDTKTESSKRLIPVHDALIDDLEQLIEQRSDELFPDCGTWQKNGLVKIAHRFSKSWGKAAKSVGKFSFHSLRAWFNVQLMEAAVADVDREALMGHSTQKVQAFYAGHESSLERLRRCVNMVPDPTA